MNTGLLRTIWTVVEEVPAYCLQRVSLSEQVSLLLQQVEDKVSLSTIERAQTRRYLNEKKTMIREMSLEQVM
ncbi:MAG: hypothetical protein WA783_09350 [Phormidesmis sp.]